jgi:GT2 family glycosyltransferase
MKSTLSIIVATYGDRRIPDVLSLLGSLFNQSHSDFEIIVVAEENQGLDDAIVSALAKPLQSYVTVLHNRGAPGISRSRNIGARHSRGDVVAFVDDDALPDPGWASEIVRTFQDDSVIGVTGPILPSWVDSEGSRLPEILHWLVGCSSWYEAATVQDIRNVWGANMAFRREAFEATGGFSEKLGGVRGTRLHGEETDFSLRVKARTGKRIVYNPKVRVMHKVQSHRLRLRNVVKTSYWYGYSRRVLAMTRTEIRGGDHNLEVERKLVLRVIRVLINRALATDGGSLIVRFHPLFVGLFALVSAAVGYLAAELSMVLPKRESA